MKLAIKNNNTGEVFNINVDKYPIYIKKGGVVANLPLWVRSLLPFESMKYSYTSKGHKATYKQIKDYVVIYKIEKEKKDEIKK